MPIQRLPDEVVNKIAAGEILVRPANAVKELLENSIDAGATSLTVIISGGGLQMIQVVDDGSGIPYEDHALVCERFATSKLREHADLLDGSVSSFGFRGEALASMSLVGHVSVFSKTSDSDHAWESRYSAGSILANFPTPASFSTPTGTRIVIEDLFFNNPVKKESFKSISSEYKRISELVSRISVCHPSIAFRLRKLQELRFDLQLEPKGGVKERIVDVYGLESDFLISGKSDDFDESLPRPLLGFEFVISNPNRVGANSSSNFIFRVNGRLVELSSLQKLILEEYSTHSKDKPEICFVSLSIDPRAIDINVSPTKREVIFTNESEVNAYILNRVFEKISESRKSKLVKLNPISFSSNLIPRGVPQPPESSEIKFSQPEPLIISTPSRFRIHTCARQNTFILPTNVSPTQGPTQLEMTFTQRRDESQLKTEVIPRQPDRFHELCKDFAPAPLGRYYQTLTFVADIEGTDFVICQESERLCVCAVVVLARELLKGYLIRNEFNTGYWTEVGGGELVPSWLKSVLVDPDTGNARIPSLGPGRDSGTSRELMESIQTLSDSSIGPLAELVVGEIILRDKMRLWNEIVKDKSYYGECSRTTETPFIREITTLKELYKDFERC